jgi:hypothetical protein
MGIKGLDTALAALEKKFNAYERAVYKVIEETGVGIKTDAASNAAGIGFFDNNGNWVQLNGDVKGNVFDSGKGYRIWVDAGKIGAYIEFGTGEYAKWTIGLYDQEWRDMAYEFYVNGKGKLPARPYMYPAYIKNTTGLRDRLIRYLKAA